MKKLLLLTMIFILSISLPTFSSNSKGRNMYSAKHKKHTPHIKKKSKKAYAVKYRKQCKNSGTWVCKGGSCGKS